MARFGIAVIVGLIACASLGCKTPTGAGETGDAGSDSGAPASCGNGQVDPGEVCDDGNTVSGDGCSSDCLSDETCGNGIVDASTGERCDDGNTIGGDGCSADCTSDETCGNGVLDTSAGETCDDGNTLPDDLCSPTCQTSALCGNGFLDPGEECDGSGVFTAMCNINCKLSKCGDGVLNKVAGEACDDGNTSDNDPCTHLCTTSRCGDGIVDTQTEECDDGNTNNSDGCQNSCKLGPGNDAAAGAIDVSAGGTFLVDLTHAHDDVRESCSDPGVGRDVFYTFTLTEDEVVYADTFGSTFDTTLSVFDGPCTARTTEEVCDDDECGTVQSQIAGLANAGTYCIVLDQNATSQPAGMATLTVRHGGRTGDEIAFGSGVIIMGDTSDGSDTNQMSASCASTGSATDHGYFFTTCPGETVALEADTCASPNFDSVVYVRSALAIGSDEVCDDDGSDQGGGAGAPSTCGIGSYVVTDVGGADADLHWIIVDGFNNDPGGPVEGPYTLTYTLQDN